MVDGEVINGEPALDGRVQWLWLDDRLMAGVADRLAQLPGAVSRVAVPHQAGAFLTVAGRLGGNKAGRGVRLAVTVPRGPGQLLAGDDPGPGLGCQVRPVAVPPLAARLAGMPRVGVNGR